MEQQNQPQPPVFNQPQQAPQPAAPQYQPRVTASPMMDPITAIKTCFQKYADFKGRARRSEFWWFALFYFVVSSVLSFLSLMVPAVGYVSLVFALAMFIPMTAALTRRLHDTNHSGWWVVLTILCAIAYYGAFAVLLGANTDLLLNTGSDPMEMVRVMAEAVQKSPGVAGVMMVSSVLTLILALILLIFACIDSKWDVNKYGPSPKYQ